MFARAKLGADLDIDSGARVALCFGRHDVALRIACLTFHRIREHLASDRLTGGVVTPNNRSDNSVYRT